MQNWEQFSLVIFANGDGERSLLPILAGAKTTPTNGNIDDGGEITSDLFTDRIHHRNLESNLTTPDQYAVILKSIPRTIPDRSLPLPTMSQKTLLPQPELVPAPITFEQYEAYTPEKLELWDGFYNYAMEDFTGFYLAVLRNMGLKEAVRNVPLKLWLEAIREKIVANLTENGRADKATIERLDRAFEALQAIAEYSKM